MGQELQEQSSQIDVLQQQAEETGQGLRSVTAGAAKMAGRAPKKGSSSGSWGGQQDVALTAVSRAVVASAPVAARYSTRR